MHARTRDSGDDGGDGMEARVAKLEADVDNIKVTLTEIKADIRDMRRTIDGFRDTLDGFRDTIDALRASIASAKVWALLLYVAQSAALLSVMAKGFHWM